MGLEKYLYKTTWGRILLKPLVSKPLTELSGRFLDTSVSKVLIGPFVRSGGIRTEDYILKDIHSFNDFFRRKIKPGLRPISMDGADLIAPCDGLLKALTVEEGKVFPVKQSTFHVRSLLRDRKLAESFEGGYILVFRLCVDHYHRYIHFDSGKTRKNRRIPGVYHTVRPVALEEFPVFTENAREYQIIDTENFGRCVQMEVGAMLVGRIVNPHPAPEVVTRGQEKGYFEYGASTVILLIPKDTVQLRDDILQTLDSGAEIPVKMGDIIGRRI